MAVEASGVGPEGLDEGRLVALVVADEPSARGAARYASRLAEDRDAKVVIVVTSPDASAALAPPAWAVELALEQGAGWSVVASPYSSFGHAARDFAGDTDSQLAILVAAPMGLQRVRPLERLVASPPAQLLVLFNADRATEPIRTAIATNTFGGLSQEATESSYRLIEPLTGGRADFVRLVEDAEVDLESVRAGIRARISARAPGFDFEVVAEHARSFESGLIDVLKESEPYDLVLVDAPARGAIGVLAQRAVPWRLVHTGTPIMVYAPAPGLLGRTFGRAWTYLGDLVPSPTEQEQRLTYAQVRRNSRASTDFFVLLGLSVLIAGFGLLVDSPAVVIGAMIIAPLMQPILGVGFGVATANLNLTRIAATSLLKGVLVAVAVAVVIGLCMPDEAITGELEARGQPNALDLMIALASGAAGAYALGRRGAASSIAGVAIAVALVPPLATVGIGIAFGESELAIGAGLLFLTNATAIASLSALMFLWMGFTPTAGRFGASSFVVRGMATLMALVAIVTVFLIARSEAADVREDERILSAVETSVQAVDEEAMVSNVESEERGDVLAIVAEVESSDFRRLQSQLPLIQSNVTVTLGEPTILELREAHPE